MIHYLSMKIALLYLLTVAILSQDSIIIENRTSVGNTITNRQLANLEYRNSTFNQLSLFNTSLANIKYINCSFDDVSFVESSISIDIFNTNISFVKSHNTRFFDGYQENFRTSYFLYLDITL